MDKILAVPGTDSLKKYKFEGRRHWDATFVKRSEESEKNWVSHSYKIEYTDGVSPAFPHGTFTIYDTRAKKYMVAIEPSAYKGDDKPGNFVKLDAPMYKDVFQSSGAKVKELATPYINYFAKLVKCPK